MADHECLAMWCRISSSKLEGVTALPVSTYSLVQSDSHDQLLIEGGVLQTDGSKLVCQQKYSQGYCQNISIGHEVCAS